MVPMRVLVVDDEKPARENLRVLLDAARGVELAGCCSTGAAAVHALTAGRPVDVLFLDIRLPDMSGFDVLRALEPDECPVVVFVTAYHQHAVRAFDVAAIDYLVKPFSDERFAAALDRARRQVEMRDAPAAWRRIEAVLRLPESGGREPPIRRLVIRANGRTELLPIAEVEWIEAFNVHVRVHAGGVVHTIRQSMHELESRLDPREFVRIHRSTIVNLSSVKALQKDDTGHDLALLRDGTRLRMSRTRRAHLEEALGQHP
jgi:two-component system LytT family response regulator